MKVVIPEGLLYIIQLKVVEIPVGRVDDLNVEVINISKTINIHRQIRMVMLPITGRFMRNFINAVCYPG